MEMETINYVTERVRNLLSEKLKARINVSQIGDAVVVSITATQDIVYTYTFHIATDCYEWYPVNQDELALKIAKRCYKRYKRYIKNLFYKEQKTLEILDTKLYNR